MIVVVVAVVVALVVVVVIVAVVVFVCFVVLNSSKNVFFVVSLRVSNVSAVDIMLLW